MNPNERHPGVQSIMQWFDASHLKGPARDISVLCGNHAQAMVAKLPDGPELTAGLRKLLEAKDCFVRAALAEKDGS